MEKIDISDSTSESSLLQRKLQSDPEFTGEDKYVLERLIAYKTRPKVILAIMKSTSLALSETDLIKLYKKHHNVSSPRGQDNHVPYRMLAGGLDKIYHYSFYGAVYEQLLAIYASPALTHVIAYEYYLRNTQQTVENAVLQFSNAYKLCQWLAVGEFTFTRCRECNLRYLHHSNTPLVKDGCPSCNIIKKRMKVLSPKKSDKLVSLRAKDAKTR